MRAAQSSRPSATGGLRRQGSGTVWEGARPLESGGSPYNSVLGLGIQRFPSPAAVTSEKAGLRHRALGLRSRVFDSSALTGV